MQAVTGSMLTSCFLKSVHFFWSSIMKPVAWSGYGILKWVYGWVLRKWTMSVDGGEGGMEWREEEGWNGLEKFPTIMQSEGQHGEVMHGL